MLVAFLASLLVHGLAGTPAGLSKSPEYGYDLVLLGSSEVVRPAFTETYDHWHGSDQGGDVRQRYSLLISSFSAVPGVTDYLLQVETPGMNLDDIDNIHVREVTTDLLWPRDSQQVPYDIFGRDAVCQPDGFLVPPKTDGNIRIVDVTDWDDAQVHVITSDPGNEWFYHNVLWRDMDGDGLPDAVTCRTYVHPVTDEPNSQFLWLRHPDGNPFDGPWDSYVISEDVCDTYLAETTLTAGGETYNVIFTIGYFSQNLAVYWSTHPDGLWDDNEQIHERIITNTGDANSWYFDVVTTDVNGDGNVDLLVPINSDHNGKLMVYEIPDDFRFDDFPAHTLADGFEPHSGMQGAGSPGQGSIFYPSVDMAGQGLKPWILLSGDDDGAGYYLVPLSEDAQDWNYDLIQFLDEGERNIVGKLAPIDADGDGYTEIYAPSYYAGQLYIYTFVPAKN